MQRFGPSDIERSKSQSTGFLSSPSGWQHYSFHVRQEWFTTMHINGTIISTLWFHSSQFVFWSFVFLMFLFLSSFTLEISLDTKERQIGRGNWLWRCSPWLLSLSLLLCLPYVIAFCFFATNISRSLSVIALFRLLHGSIILLYAKSFLNPLLYTMRMPGFRRALEMLCRPRPQPPRQVQIFPLREINPRNWMVLVWETWTFKKVLWR